ncbi:hypothetical protein ACFOET_11635 [Parapedobacter deserti]|uniref:HTTM-like domain-containing protein n=1 Tax=Parapedobacter deserti TaxID=1912957 RepID=A0ABV7JJV6_9SPHI
MKHFLFDAPLRPGAIRLLHTGTGVLLAIQALFLLPDVSMLYGPAGIVDQALVHGRTFGITITDIVRGTAHLIGDYEQHFVKLIAVLYIALATMLALGRLPCVGIGTLLAIHALWHTSGSAFSYGVDYLSATALFYCLCTPRARPMWHAPALRLLQLHLCIIYFFSGLAKALGATWWNGEALWKAVNQPYHLDAVPGFIAWLGQFTWLWAVGGWGVIMLELGYALFIWLHRLRPYWLWSIVGMHMGIALVIGLFQFAAVMILLNVVAYHYAYHTETEQPVYPSNKKPSRLRWAVWKQPHHVAGDTREGGI